MFNVRSTLTHRAEGSNNTTKRRGLRCGIIGVGSENPKSFSAPVHEKTVQKRKQTICREQAFSTVAKAMAGGRRSRHDDSVTRNDARLGF